MRIKLTPIVKGLYLLGIMSAPAFAATDATPANEGQLIEKLSQQTAALQKEVAQLQKQVKYLKTQQHPAHKPPQVDATDVADNSHPGVIPVQSVYGNAGVATRPAGGKIVPKSAPVA